MDFWDLFTCEGTYMIHWVGRLAPNVYCNPQKLWRTYVIIDFSSLNPGPDNICCTHDGLLRLTFFCSFFRATEKERWKKEERNDRKNLVFSLIFSKELLAVTLADERRHSSITSRYTNGVRMSFFFFCLGRNPDLNQIWFSRLPKSGKIVQLHTKQNCILSFADTRRNYHVTVHEWCHSPFLLLFGENPRPTPNLISQIAAEKRKNLQVTYETIPPPLSRELLIEKGNGNSVVAELANTKNLLRRCFTKHVFLFFCCFPNIYVATKATIV